MPQGARTGFFNFPFLMALSFRHDRTFLSVSSIQCKNAQLFPPQQIVIIFMTLGYHYNTTALK